MKYLYIVEYWVPFPITEYGGVISVIAESNEDCYNVLFNFRDDNKDSYDSLIMDCVKEALRFELSDSHADEESRVVNDFTT